jgi:hypothetical protein
MIVIGWITLLHPALAIAGAAAGAIPIIIHLINRRRHRRVPWAAMVFLLTAARRRTRRMRLEQWLLLAVRILAIALLGLALARPTVSATRLMPLGPAAHHRVIVLDNSGSMGATLAAGASALPPGSADSGVGSAAQVFERARRTVTALLNSFPATDEISVVALAAPATAVIGEPSFDRRRISEALEGVPLTQRGTDVAGGLALAAELLERSAAAPDNRRVYVVSDFAERSWTQGGTEGRRDEGAGPAAVSAAAKRVAERATLVLVPVGDPGAGNVGLARLTRASPVTAVQVPVRFTAEIVNYGAVEVRGAVLQARVLEGGSPQAERVARRITLPPLAPGRTETVPFAVAFDSPGAHAVHVHVDAGPVDRLALDNDRWLAVDAVAALKVLVVDGAPGKTRRSGQARYLLTALHPWSAADSAGFVAPKVVSDLELGGEVLADYAVVMLCNVERLDADLWRRLGRYVEEGGGLLVFAGEAVNVDEYNRLGYAGGQGVLPGRVEPAEGESAGPAGAPAATEGRTASSPSVREGLGFAAGDPAHPVMADFAGLPGSGLFTARIWRRMPLTALAPLAEVPVRYTDGTPAVIVAPRGAGRCGFVTTTADMAWNSLPAKGDYVSLMMNLAAYLAQPPARDRNVLVGEPLVRRLTAEESTSRLQVRLPTDAVADTAATVGAGGFELRYAATDQAGLYTTLVGGTAQTAAVNAPLAESALHPLDRAALEKALDVPFTYVADPAELPATTAASGVRELGQAAVYVVLFLVLGECWLAMRHAHPVEDVRRASARPGPSSAVARSHDR